MDAWHPACIRTLLARRSGTPSEIFGQSDRDLIENADYKGNITQALFLMNSPQSNAIFAQRSTPVLEARRADTPEKKLETLYIGFLARKPTEQEKRSLLPSFKKDPEKARERIIWAMLNNPSICFYSITPITPKLCTKNSTGSTNFPAESSYSTPQKPSSASA